MIKKGYSRRVLPYGMIAPDSRTRKSGPQGDPLALFGTNRHAGGGQNASGRETQGQTRPHL